MYVSEGIRSGAVATSGKYFPVKCFLTVTTSVNNIFLVITTPNPVPHCRYGHNRQMFFSILFGVGGWGGTRRSQSEQTHMCMPHSMPLWGGRSLVPSSQHVIRLFLVQNIILKILSVVMLWL
jgi:hypothetical protein